MSEAESSAKTRREFLKDLGVATAGMPLVASLGGGTEAVERPPGMQGSVREITLTVNGAIHSLEVEPRKTLAEVLRDELGLTGTKVSCNRATCGACTVVMEGRPVFACHTLAVQADGRSVLTIEGLSTGEKLHPIQEAFIEHDAFQCGFCTPGMIMALKAALDRNPNATREQVRYAIAGNLCRCAAYEHILNAAVAAAPKLGVG